MKRQELLKNPGYWTSKIQFELYDELLDYMKVNKLNKSQFAKKIGVSKGYISQVLNGDFNHKISKLVELSLAIDKIPKIDFIDVNKYINEDSEGIKTISWKLKQSPLYNIKPSNSESTGSKEGTLVSFGTTAEPILIQGNS